MTNAQLIAKLQTMDPNALVQFEMSRRKMLTPGPGGRTVADIRLVEDFGKQVIISAFFPIEGVPDGLPALSVH